MHLLKIDVRLQINADEFIEPGELVVEAISGAQLLYMAGGGTMRPLEETRPFDETKDWNGKRLLFVRVGGIGDIVLLTPVLREIKRRWPRAVIHLCAHKEFGTVVQNLPFVGGIVDYPMTLAQTEAYDSWTFYENAIERNEEAKKLHSVDVYAKLIGLTGMADEDKNQEYRVTERERIWAEEAYPRINGTRRLCVQTTASARCRTYPGPLLEKVMTVMLAKGWEVFLMGKPGEIRAQEVPGMRILTNGLTLRQRCAVIAGADCVLAPDSALAHIAGALAVPCVALYAVFPWQVRTKYSPTTFALSGTGACAPCFHHQHADNYFPPNCPSASRGVCEVMESIDPKKIVQKIEVMAKGFELKVLA